MKIKTVGLFSKLNDDSVKDVAANIKNSLEKKGLNILLTNITLHKIEDIEVENIENSIGELIQLAIVLGGDGTMLTVSRMLAQYDIPAIGINMGRVGFLTDSTIADFDHHMDKILAGEFIVEKRTMLKCSVKKGKETVFKGNALNDFAISKGNTGRPIEFQIHVNDQFVSQPRSDGIILATPTGSTAYALSAGGPIVYPNLPVIILSPICPHTLTNRPIILDENDRIEVSFFRLPESTASLALDGVISHNITGDEIVCISGADKKLKMLRIESFNHFETLQSKLGWST